MIEYSNYKLLFEKPIRDYSSSYLKDIKNKEEHFI